MIHQYKLGGYNIVLDVCSGALHVVDDVTYDIIERMNEIYEHQEKLNAGNDGKNSGMIDVETLIDRIPSEIEKKYAGTEMGDPKEIGECFCQVKELQNAGKLFTPDTYEPMAGELKAKTSGVVKAPNRRL